MKVLAFIVTYYPNNELLKKNIEVLLKTIDKIIIWDNTPMTNNGLKDMLPNDPRIILDGGQGNVGLPKSYNHAWSYARGNDYDHILIMDQDSIWHNLDQFINNVSNSKYLRENIVGPYSCKQEDDVREFYRRQNYIYNSGMLVPTKVLNKVHGWPETFLIDCVDIDFCFKCREGGVDILLLKKGWIERNLGEKKDTISFRNFRKSSIRTYSSKRLYSIIRNGVIMKRKYHEFSLKKYLRYWFFIHARIILLHDSNKFKKITSMIRGLFVGLFVNYSK